MSGQAGEADLGHHASGQAGAADLGHHASGQAGAADLGHHASDQAGDADMGHHVIAQGANVLLTGSAEATQGDSEQLDKEVKTIEEMEKKVPPHRLSEKISKIRSKTADIRNDTEILQERNDKP